MRTTTTVTAAQVDATFDQIFNSCLAESTTEFSAAEVARAFAAQGVKVEEAADKHFAASCAGDDDWSMV